MNDKALASSPSAPSTKGARDAHAGEANGAGSSSVPTDRIFAEPDRPRDFRFDHRTAGVFDDMVSRSVPFYAEIQRMTGELAADFAVPGTNLYDLGCATATTLAELEPLVDPAVRFVTSCAAGARAESTPKGW